MSSPCPVPLACAQTPYTTLTELARGKKQDLALVAALAGHAKLTTTAIYVQPNMQDLEAAVDSLMED